MTKQEPRQPIGFINPRGDSQQVGEQMSAMVRKIRRDSLGEEPTPERIAEDLKEIDCSADNEAIARVQKMLGL